MAAERAIVVGAGGISGAWFPPLAAEGVNVVAVVVVASSEGFQREVAPLEIAEAKLEFGGQHGAIREMLAFLREGTTPQCECRDNIKSLAMVFGAVESSRRGERVEIEDV